MNMGMSARLKRMARVVACLGAIELCLPGGTLIVLGYLLAGRPHVPVATEGERAFKVVRDLRGSFPQTRVPAIRAGRRLTNRRAGDGERASGGESAAGSRRDGEMSWIWLGMGGALVLGVCLGVMLMSLLTISRTRA
jgi:hypothetical protein